MATFLFIDTSASESLIGLAEDGEWLQTENLPDARRLGEILHITVSSLLQKAQKEWQELSAIAVVSGPGSYTGLRVGMAAAKGWCFALSIPLISLNRMELLLLQARKEKAFSGNTLLLLPARTGEWFAIGADASSTLLFPARHMTEESLNAACIQWSFQKVILAGSQPYVLPAGFTEKKVIQTAEKVVFTGLAALLREKYQKKDFVDLILSKPEYLKGVYISG